MADNYGGLLLPTEATATGEDPVLPLGDPSLGALAGFCRAVLNAELDAAWRELRPRDAEEGQPCRAAYTNDPARYGFHPKSLPSLYLWRTAWKPERRADDYRVNVARLRLLWVFPTEAKQEVKAGRQAFANAVALCLDQWFEAGRHPAWVAVEDEDPAADGADASAASFAADPNAFLVAKATSLAPVTYSGAGLDGTLGTADLDPRRELTVTTAAAADAYNTTADIVATGVDWFGSVATHALRFTSADGGETLAIGDELVSLTSLALPAMVTTAGRIEAGTAAITGLGSSLTRRARLFRTPRIVDAQPKQLEIEIVDARGVMVERIAHESVECTIEIEELLTLDPTRFAYQPWTTEHAVRVDDYTATQARLPDDGIDPDDID